MNFNNLHFHIQENDLFGTVATVLDLVKEDIEKRGYQREHAELLRQQRDELLFLQRNNYRIITSDDIAETSVADIGGFDRHPEGCPGRHNTPSSTLPAF